MEDIFGGYGVEIQLIKPTDFLVVKETLTRIGIVCKEEKILEQIVFILHKRGRYAIIHEQELHAMDGDDLIISETELTKRNRIVALLVEWGLVKVGDPVLITEMCPLNQLKVLNFKEKREWALVPKYRFTEKRRF